MATTTTSTKLPDYIEKPTKNALGSIEDFLNSNENYVYGSKPGESLYTPLSSSQDKAIGNVNWLADQDLAAMFGLNDAAGMWSDYGDDMSSAGSERLVDEGGWLGSMSDYMNPFTDAVLDPAIREMEEAYKRNNNDLMASTAMSGSFGDARHGIAESENFEKLLQGIGDTTSSVKANAFDRAMGLRSGDINRLFSAQESSSNRKANAAQGMQSVGDQYFGLWRDVNDTLFNAGQVERDAEIEKQDALRQFQEAMSNKKYDDALRMLGAIRGVPYETNSTTKEKSNDGFFNLIGSALGAFIP